MSEDKSIFHGKSQVLRYDIIKELKAYFKNNSAKYGLLPSHISEIENLLPQHFGGIIDKGEIKTAIRLQEQKVRDMASDPKLFRDYKQQNTERGKLKFLQDIDNLH